MKARDLNQTIDQIIREIEKRIPAFKDNPEDWSISEGNTALCIITEDGKIYGKVYGTDKLRQRAFYKIAWQKASQVWITGQKTGDYEKIVFGGDMDPEDSPIALPDLIGWVGGQPIVLSDGTRLSIGFSGFRGFNDIDIVKKAIRQVDL
jgi:glc operon protein GlcG